MSHRLWGNEKHWTRREVWHSYGARSPWSSANIEKDLGVLVFLLCPYSLFLSVCICWHPQCHRGVAQSTDFLITTFYLPLCQQHREVWIWKGSKKISIKRSTPILHSKLNIGFEKIWNEKKPVCLGYLKVHPCGQKLAIVLSLSLSCFCFCSLAFFHFSSSLSLSSSCSLSPSNRWRSFLNTCGRLRFQQSEPTWFLTQWRSHANDMYRRTASAMFIMETCRRPTVTWVTCLLHWWTYVGVLVSSFLPWSM